jgi:hypothetical protein
LESRSSWNTRNYSGGCINNVRLMLYSVLYSRRYYFTLYKNSEFSYLRYTVIHGLGSNENVFSMPVYWMRWIIWTFSFMHWSWYLFLRKCNYWQPDIVDIWPHFDASIMLQQPPANIPLLTRIPESENLISNIKFAKYTKVQCTDMTRFFIKQNSNSHLKPPKVNGRHQNC